MLAALAAAIALSLIGRQADAQQQLVTFNVAGPADWNVDGNWNPPFVPAATLNEVAVLNSGRVAFVHDTPVSPGGVIMDNATLEIRSGGNLNVVPGTATTGNVVAGQSVATHLTVKRGGTLSAQGLITGGAAASTLLLGETTGSGVSTVSVASADLNQRTRIVGPNVSFSSSGNVTFGATSVLNPVITGAAHSVINAAGTAFLDGVVRPEFSGHTPVLGNAWNLVTAGSIQGRLEIDRSLAPAPVRGADYVVTTTATTATLRYMNLLVLAVDRGTGAVSIQNVVGSPIALDAYTITSPSGRLAGTWNSLQDQGVANWDEADNSSATRRTEFKTAGSTSVSVGGGGLNLGNLLSIQTPSGFGVPVGADLSFQYSSPTLGTLDGIVEFTGRENDMVLTINPATGEAAIQNESPFFDVAIDGYTIASASGKLLTGDAAWNSLQDQGLPAWDQADNSNANRITEFKTAGSTAMPGGGTVLDLGAPVNIASGPLSLSDFSFQFSLSTGGTRTGLVKFGAIPTPGGGDAGDYDDDGDVDGADFLRWQRTLGSAASPPGAGADGNNNGTIDAGDLAVWRTNFGAATAAGGAAIEAVPEPSALAVVASGLMAVVALRPRRVGAAGGAR
ncbi:MAG: hypothetical protein DCC67_11550 [Planctomycetota bacterium]|nr:MAG: hypothetical protein DCC67_11550 [Planctomycetota bacterium]